MNSNNYGLPSDYSTNLPSTLEDVPYEYWTPRRLRNSARYQWHVYSWAADLISSQHYTSVIDLGCGPGIKLHEHIYGLVDSINGVDQQSAVEICRGLMPNGHFYAADLVHRLPEKLPRADLIIACDVIEHVTDPDAFLESLKSVCKEDTYIVISTPDRARLHGQQVRRPVNPAHIREWSATEFLNYLNTRGIEVLEHRHFPPVKQRLDLLTTRLFLKQIMKRKSWRYNLAVLCTLS